MRILAHRVCIPCAASKRRFPSVPILAGALLIAGFLTPMAAAGLTLLHGSVAMGVIDTAQGGRDLQTAWLLPIVSAAVLLLGPGAFALDARLFGRREIRIARARGSG